MNELTLSKRTLDILTNFAAVNQSILFRKGKVLRSMASSYQMFTRADIVEDIPEEFAIYDLNAFLTVMSTYDKPLVKLDSKNNRMLITAPRKKTVLKYGDVEHMVVPNEGDIKLKNVFCKFDLTKESLNNIQKMLGVLSLPEFAIVAKSGKLAVECINSENVKQNENTENYHSEEIGDTDAKDFRIIIRGEYVNQLLKSENYKVEIGSFEKDKKPVALIGLKGSDVNYFIASEDSSEF